MADEMKRLLEEVEQAMPGEGHQPSITDRGARAVCHSRGDSRHYVAYLERPDAPDALDLGPDPVLEAPDDVVREVLKTRSDPSEEAMALRLRYLRSFEDSEAFEAGKLYEELSLAIRGSAIALPEVLEDKAFRNQREIDHKRGLQLVEQIVFSRRRRNLIDSLIEAEERSSALDDSTRSFWELTRSQLQTELEESIPDAKEREDLVALHRYRRATEEG